MGGKRYIAAIDDTGIPKPAINWEGAFLPGPFPFVGLASLALTEEASAELEGRWTHLRGRIQRKLRTSESPAIHLSWMWGKNPNRRRGRNPYVDADFRDIRGWLSDARNILLSLMRSPSDVGTYAEFLVRQQFAEGLAAYYNDPHFAAELEFFRSYSFRGERGGLYRIYHTITASPLVRTLAVLLWRIESDLAEIPGATLQVIVDRFSGADSVDEQAVLQACTGLAGLARITSLSRSVYSDSSLTQAADFLAYSYNRLLLMEKGHIRRDAFFDEVASPLLMQGRSLAGWPVHEAFSIPDEVLGTTLCVVYALARHEISERSPDFASKYMVSVEEFHERATSAQNRGATGVSILRDGVLQGAKK